MNFAQKIIHKIKVFCHPDDYAFGGYKTYQEYHEAYTQSILNQIRKGGGYCGDDVDFYELDIDMGVPAAYHIGTRVTLTNCRLLTHDAAITKATGCVRMGHIFIGDDVYVGAGAIILPNVSIGNKVIIGAGSVVAKDIPDNSVVVGNPCKIIHSFDETISKNMKNMRKNPACTRKELSSKFQRAKQQDGFYYIKVTDKYDGLFENLSE